MIASLSEELLLLVNILEDLPFFAWSDMMQFVDAIQFL
jgi:hypothetical protein